jgi:hypothetical protein
MLHMQNGVESMYTNRFIGQKQHTKHSCSLRVFEEPLHDDFEGQRTLQCSSISFGHPGIQGSILSTKVINHC